MTEKILSFRNLRIYHAAFGLQQEVFELTQRFPKEELRMLGKIIAAPEKFCRTQPSSDL